MFEYDDSGSEGDFSQTFKEVDASFVVSDARKSFGRTFDPRAILGESDESDYSNSDVEKSISPVVPVRAKNVRRLISSDDSSETDIPREEQIQEISSDSEAASSHTEKIIELSSEDDDNFVVSPGLSVDSRIPKLPAIQPNKQPEVSAGPIQNPGVSAGSTQQPRVRNGPFQQPGVSNGPTQRSRSDGPFQQPGVSAGSTQQPGVSNGPSQRSRSDGPFQQPGVSDGPTQQPGVSNGPSQRSRSDGPFQQPGVSDGPTQQPGVSNGPSQRSRSDGPFQQPGVSDGPSQRPRVSPGTIQKPGVATGSFEEALAANKVQVLVAKISEKKMQYSQIQAALKGTEVSQLYDGGQKLLNRAAILSDEILALETAVATLASIDPAPSEAQGVPVARTVVPKAVVAAPQWNAIRNTTDIQHGFGAKALESYTVERDSALATLASLHRALKTRPGKEVAKAPRALRSDTTLMPHQLRALAWLAWREAGAKPCGGILADDMGLGKTLAMIALVMSDLESRDSDSEDDDCYTTTKSHSKKSVKGGTLVICPASLVGQWEGEVRRRVKSDKATVEVHHGSNREKRGYRLARRTLVVSTYAIVRTEHASHGALHQVHWRRIILDEAHVVRNHKSKTAEAVFSLMGRFRWCLTGTPVHNKELDLFALIKFIGCTPFDDVNVWKRWIDNKGNNGAERLNLLLGCLLLRRTKAELQGNEELQGLSSKELHTCHVALTEQETAVYEKILAFSKSMFAKFLQQRHEREAIKNGDTNYKPLDFKNLQGQVFEPGTKLGKMADKYASMSDIKSDVILVLLLRLRQTCVHATLVSSMLDMPTLEPANEEEDDELAGALGKLRLREAENSEEDEECVSEDSFWTPENPVFDGDSISSKMQAVLDILQSPSVANGDDKAVVVSQWVSMLNLLEKALKQKRVHCVKLCGATQVRDRKKMVDDFNNAKSDVKVMLLSLTAGGVGLNLVGANHLLLCDLHWNPQLEAQACDRIFRVGQTKPVHIYKFICKDTIEENIQALQEKKMAIATDVLTGARDSLASKLSFDDLKMLFGVK